MNPVIDTIQRPISLVESNDVADSPLISPANPSETPTIDQSQRLVHLEAQRIVEIALSQNKQRRVDPQELDDMLRDLIGHGALAPELQASLERLCVVETDPGVLQTTLGLLEQTNSPRLKQIIDQRLHQLRAQRPYLSDNEDLVFTLVNQLKQIAPQRALDWIGAIMKDPILLERSLLLASTIDMERFNQFYEELQAGKEQDLREIAERVRRVM